MLTVSSRVFECDRNMAAFAAECANLRHLLTTNPQDRSIDSLYPSYRGGQRAYDLWEDSQTSGGGCRLVWSGGIVWISRHSGYAYADVTGEVAEVLAEMGAKPLDSDQGDYALWHNNPHIYS